MSAWNPATYSKSWREALIAMVRGASRVALMTWAIPPPSDAVRRAYVLYREGVDVFVQADIRGSAGAAFMVMIRRELPRTSLVDRAT